MIYRRSLVGGRFTPGVVSKTTTDCAIASYSLRRSQAATVAGAGRKRWGSLCYHEWAVPNGIAWILARLSRASCLRSRTATLAIKTPSPAAAKALPSPKTPSESGGVEKIAPHVPNPSAYPLASATRDAYEAGGGRARRLPTCRCFSFTRPWAVSLHLPVQAPRLRRCR